MRGKRGFTLIELMVVVGMIALILGAITTSVTSARRRAQIQKAVNDVKVISQAILAYENYGGLETTGGWKPADKSNLGIIFGRGDSKGGGSGTFGQNVGAGGQLPVLIETALNGSGKILDPWGHPYEFKVTSGDITFETEILKSDIKSGFRLPNHYRISEVER